ncbi:hypothetical protein DL769_003721 [Monosporascus sp. CRB-8-3]|nr:hypothetical protein DL769_003721 [Monosporascus sp. CRB-8-3]
MESHTLPLKLKAIADAGFDAVELSMPDILSYGKMLNGKEPDPKDYDALIEIGKAIREQARLHNLKILMLQPFANFEGWPRGSTERRDAFERARGWMRIMEAVGTDMLQIGSSDATGISSSFDELAADLAELADIMATKKMRIAYENWCWATHASTWKDVWQIVAKADRPNIGLCLDTFQSAGGEWADPTTESGLVEGLSKDELEARWKRSLDELASTVPSDKIFLLQISDAYKMEPPLEAKEKEEGLRPRGQWSNDYRPLPFVGGYLPIGDFLSAVLKTGFRSWLSIEVFDSKGPENLKRQAHTAAPSASGDSDGGGGARKPLNAFLGELFLGTFRADNGGSETQLIAEQVSHHPPVTACFMYNKKHGISSSGYVAQETSFSPTSGVHVKQIGHSIIRDEEHRESHLMTLPTMLVKGLLTGSLYPELEGACYICSSSGYLATIEFDGNSSLGIGTKNGVSARITNVGDGGKAVFEISGQWNARLKITDCRTEGVIEEFDVDDMPLSELNVKAIEEQNP